MEVAEQPEPFLPLLDMVDAENAAEKAMPVEPGEVVIDMVGPSTAPAIFRLFFGRHSLPFEPAVVFLRRRRDHAERFFNRRDVECLQQRDADVATEFVMRRLTAVVIAVDEISQPTKRTPAPALVIAPS